MDHFEAKMIKTVLCTKNDQIMLREKIFTLTLLLMFVCAKLKFWCTQVFWRSDWKIETKIPTVFLRTVSERHYGPSLLLEND